MYLSSWELGIQCVDESLFGVLAVSTDSSQGSMMFHLQMLQVLCLSKIKVAIFILSPVVHEFHLSLIWVLHELHMSFTLKRVS